MLQRPFRYFADPICVSALVIYAANRWLLKPNDIGGTFGSCYLNDVLCLPLFLPMILRVQRWMRLRKHDEPPRMWEILQHWSIFSIVFEVILPMFPQSFRTTRDPMDVVAYLIGGVIAWLWWRTTPADFGFESTRGLYLCPDARSDSFLCSRRHRPASL